MREGDNGDRTGSCGTSDTQSSRGRHGRRAGQDGGPRCRKLRSAHRVEIGKSPEWAVILAQGQAGPGGAGRGRAGLGRAGSGRAGPGGVGMPPRAATPGRLASESARPPAPSTWTVPFRRPPTPNKCRRKAAAKLSLLRLFAPGDPFSKPVITPFRTVMSGMKPAGGGPVGCNPGRWIANRPRGGNGLDRARSFRLSHRPSLTTLPSYRM